MKFKLKPYQHQLDAIDASKLHTDYALFWEMGTGKSGGMINMLRYKYYTHQRVLRTLIVSPLVTLENWKSEFLMHSTIKEEHIIVCNRAGKPRIKSLLTNLYHVDIPQNKVVLINYEAFTSKEILDILHTWGPEIMVLDESHNVKNPKSKRAKQIRKLAKGCMHRYLLTGTPILNSPQDIFNQYLIMDGGTTFSDNFWVFRDTYFYDMNAGMRNTHNYWPKWVPIEEKFPELTEKIYSKASRVLKEDCLDLPPLVKQTILVQMSATQERMYKEMSRDFFTWYEDKLTKQTKAAVATVAITKILRLQQIATGFIKDEEGKEFVIEDNPRLEAVKNILEEITVEHKVIIWACFKQNYKQLEKLCNKLKIQYTSIYGGMSDTIKQENMNAFRKNERTRVIICNQRSAGSGINLVEAAYSIYYSKNFAMGDQLQSESRNHRGGSEQHAKITHIHLCAAGTIDETIINKLQGKEITAAKILDIFEETK